MQNLPFTRPPDLFDERGDAVYRIDQVKGLFEATDYDLMQRQIAEGFTAVVAEALFSEVVALAHTTAPSPPWKIVEFGGGPGAMFDRLTVETKTFVNVEPGEFPVTPEDERRRQDGRFHRISCTAESVPLPDGWADVVIAIASLDHVPEPCKAIREAARLLRREGVFIVVLNNRRSWWKVALQWTPYLRHRQARIARSHSVQWSLDETVEEVSRWMEVEKAYTRVFIPFVPRLWRWVLPLADQIGRAFPKRGANSIVVARRK